MNKKYALLTFFLVLFIQSLAQPGTKVKELYRDRHKFDGCRYGHPYTTFDMTSGQSLDSIINQIRKRIKKEYNSTNPGPICAAYQFIYTNAISPRPYDGGLITHDAQEKPVGPSGLALWAKNNAFVMLVGLNGEGDTLSLAQRDSCKGRVLEAFENLYSEIPNENIQNFGKAILIASIPLQPIVSTPMLVGALIAEEKEKEKYKLYSRSLILWLQAYDLLKASAALTELNSIKYENNFDSDANKGKYSPRNKLRYQTRNLYQQSQGLFGIATHRWGWKKNHGIACASALLMAAQVLNDAGVETNILQGNPIYKLFGGTSFNPFYSPIKWNKFANEALPENIFEGKHWIPVDDNPVAPCYKDENKFSPYSEGPVYCEYGLVDCGLPAFRAQQNFYPSWSNDVFLKKNEFINIYRWLDEICVGANKIPTYDGSRPGNLSWLLGITNDEKMYRGAPGDNKDQLADLVAIIGGNNIALNTEPRSKYNKDLTKEGNILLRRNTDHGNYYFHMLAEEGVEVDKKSGLFGTGGTHEEPDLGSFFIWAGNDQYNMTQLGVDCPSFGWSDHESTNKYWMHNVIEIDNGISKEDRLYVYPNDPEIKDLSISNKEFSLKYDYKDNHHLVSEAITRNVEELDNEGNVYYFISDFINVENLTNSAPFTNSFQGVKLIFNGNGRFHYYNSFKGVDNLYNWRGPCSTSGVDNDKKWQISSHHCALKGGGGANGAYVNWFESNSEAGTRAKEITGGSLTRLEFFQPGKKKTIFHSVYFPQKCNDSLPKVFQVDTLDDKLITQILFYNSVDTITLSNGILPPALAKDTSVHFLLTKWQPGQLDSVSNPLRIASKQNTTLYFLARKIFLEYHTLDFMYKNFGFCPPVYAHVRKYFTKDSKLLVLDDTLFNATKAIDFDFSIKTKNTFFCRISTKEGIGSTDSLKLKLPGTDRGLDMVALIDNTKDTLHGHYDSLTNYIYLGLKEGNYNITIQPKDPCLDCYFPPVGTDFDTLFLANDGLPHTLGNSKEITDNHGNLSILNGTEVNMCAGVILHNKDSLILEGPPQTKAIAVSSCAGIDSLAKGSDNSMLIISPGSALVLDAGSQTYVKNGASLFVKQNGSLVIKSGATLEIGDSGRAGWGELIAEPGAFIYIEDGAQIRYRRCIGDTADMNTINFAIGNGGVIAGIHWYIDSVLKAESILPSVTSPIAICSLDSINPIGNPYWGYTNFGRPKATFTTESLNLCPGNPFKIELERLLNDAQMRIVVCRVDSVWRFDGNSNGFWKDTCVNDSIVMDSLPPDPNCLKPRVAPKDWLWYFPVNTTHRVHITVKNECGWAHDTLVEVTVRDTPQISLNVNTTACEGYGTVKAVAQVNRTGPLHYAFEVTELPDTLNPIYSLANPTEEYSFDTLASVPDTFDFPGFYFKGGRKYIVSFTLLDDCGNNTLEQEINVPTGAYIQLERPTVYANPVHGAKQVQLHGYVNSADSFSWSPTTWLNRTDSLVVLSTPGDSIQYVLTAYKNNCIAYDTATIKYNRVANAGEEDTVCYTGSKVVLGNAYDLSLFLGYLYFKGGSDFRDNWFFSRTSANPEYFKYLSMFMQTTTFKSWAMGAGNVYLHFTEELYREETMKQHWFANYFEQLTEFTDPNMYALDSFVTNLGGNSNLTDNYNSVGDYINISSGFTDFFSYYDDFVSNNLNTISMSWHKIVGNDTLFNGSLQESAIAVDEPTQTTTYIQQVITPEYAEIDEVVVYVDTIPVVAFAPQLQMDSTVVFENFTAPTDGSTHYSWNFGDGSSTSNDVHPYHTFPAFDTSFVVCLTAINDCGNYTWCDTVYIDSAHWGGGMRVSEEREREGEGVRVTERVVGEGIEAWLYPNPTEGNCTLAYHIHEVGTLWITDAMGKLVWETTLPASSTQMPLLQIPSQTFTSGIYFYTLQTNSGRVRGRFVVRK